MVIVLKLTRIQAAILALKCYGQTVATMFNMPLIKYTYPLLLECNIHDYQPGYTGFKNRQNLNVVVWKTMQVDQN